MDNFDVEETGAIWTMLAVVVLILVMTFVTGCATTKIAPDGQGNYQAIMESQTFMGIGTDYAERVNGSMQVNELTQKELDDMVKNNAGGGFR